MSSNASTMAIGTAVAALFSLSVHGAHADPVPDGFELSPLTTDVIGPRGLERRGEHVLVLGVQGDMSAVDRAGLTTPIAQFGPGTWIGPALNPATGAIYASNYAHHYVAELINGEVTTIATVQNPAGLVVSEDGGTLYVSSYSTHQVLAIDTVSYEVSTCTSGYYLPDGLEFWNGDLYVANRGAGTIVRVVGGCGQQVECASELFDNPIDIASGADGLFVADYGNGDILRTEAECSVEEFASGFQGPAGIETLADDVFVAEYATNTVWRIAEFGILGSISGLNSPISVCCWNLTSGQREEITLGPEHDVYDCTSAELAVSEGDLVKISIQSGPPDPDFCPERMADLSN